MYVGRIGISKFFNRNFMHVLEVGNSIDVISYVCGVPVYRNY